MEIIEKLQIPTKLLNISEVKVIESYINTNKEIIIKVSSTKEDIHCHKCGALCQLYGQAETIRIRHLPIFGYKTYIEITAPRGVCSECKDGKKRITTTQRANWYTKKGKITKAYEDYLLLSVINSTIQDVSIKEDVGYKVIESTIDKNIKSEVDWSEIKKIGLLGIDEIAARKGRNQFYTIFTSKVDGQIRLLAVIEGHEKADVKKMLKSIPKRLKKTIKAVCTDMHDGFVYAVQEELPNSLLVIDRFHVAKSYRECLKAFRIAELQRLKNELSGEKYKEFKKAIHIIKNNKNGILTDEEKRVLKPIFKKAPNLKKAFQLSRKLTNIFNSHISIKKAEILINSWMGEVEASKLTCYNKFLKTLRKYKTEITNYFKSRNNSGFVEGINNKIKVMKRRCYGISNIKHFFQRVFLDLQGYAQYAINPQVRAC